jgi:5-aminolevulinate synthase
MADLEAQLKQYPLATPKVIAVISVYSMDGDIAPLSDIITLAKKYNALTYVDEVHAVGIYGPTGAGIAERDNLAKEVDIIQGNFAKAIGVVGGYIAGNANLVDFVRSFASGFIFTTSLPPAVAAAAKASIDYLKKGEALRTQLHENVAYLKNALTTKGVRFIQSPSHIIPIVIGNAFHCKQITDALLSDFGHYAQPINYPTVPRGQERLRITVSPHHTPAHMDDFAAALAYLIEATTTLAA